MPLVDTPAQEFLQLYGEEAWKDWQRLLAHFDLGEGFAFLVLLLPGAVGADICRRQLADHLTDTGKRLAVLPCEEYENVRRLPDRLFNLEIEPNLGGLWLGCVIPDSDAEIRRWKEAWRIGLASLNQHRNTLLRRFPCPLVLVGAPWLQTLLREAAPDLWSVRTAVVNVTPAPEPSLRAESDKVSEKTFQAAVGEAASDPDYALEQGERLRGRKGLEATRAELLLRAGNGFREHVRYEQAERCFREAAGIYAAIASTSPDLQSDWAGTLNNLAITLSALGRREEALSKAQESVRIYEQLAQARPDAFLPYLAMSLNNLATILSELGRREEALAKAQEAVRIREQLAQARPDAFLPDLAGSLNNLATMLSDLGRREEALAKAQEAVRIREQLAQARPDAFLPDLAGSLNNLANRLSDLGRREEALAKAQEAKRIYQQLAQARPDAFLPDLAGSLNNLAIMLSDLGRREEALSKAQESVRIREQLAQARPDAFVPDLAKSCGVLGSVLHRMERYADAADCYAHGIRLLTPLFQKAPQPFVGLMADLCQSYSEATQQAKAEPDMALLAPVQELLKKLKQNPPR